MGIRFTCNLTYGAEPDAMSHHLTVNFSRMIWAGAKLFMVLLFLQVSALLIVSILEVVGLAALQRNILEYAAFIYEPSWLVFRYITPADWFSLGNVLLGFAAMGFGIVLYSLIGGIIGGVLAWRYKYGYAVEPQN